jgi:ribosome biogenesis protein
MDDKQICTCSWDHSIKIWDMFAAQETRTLQSQNKIFLSIDYSSLNNTLIAGLSDRHIRLYDPRSNEGSLVKSTFTSHNGWISNVQWSKQNEYLFVSGSYDCLAKLWDTRSPRAPLYDMSGHEDKILAVDWSLNDYILTGSADNTFKIFSVNTKQEVKKNNQFID